MVDHFINTYKRLIFATDFQYQRYLYHNFSIDSRLTGLIGARGTGKTTLLLQFIKQNIPLDDAIYVSLDHLYFTQNTLIDFVETLYEHYGVRYFFFDEAHKYENWNQELKNLYDMYPDIYLVFSGSSSLDLVQGSYDLSRRGVIYQLAGMSFREYLLFSNLANFPTFSFSDVINKHSEIEPQLADMPKLLGYFKNYLGAGYYPFLFENKEHYQQKLHRTVEKTIYEDISNYYQLKTENLSYLKKILAYVATTPPNTLNVNNISKNIGLTNKTVQHYLNILNETKMLSLISKNKAGSHLLKSSNKIYLNNADLYQVISNSVGFEADIGTKREIFFMNMLTNLQDPQLNLYVSEVGDFDVRFNQESLCFEIGGKSKKTKQIQSKIKNNEDAFLVKDDILYGSRYEIPLYLFGFMY